MDSDRSTISRSGPRPITRWKREQESTEKSNVFSDRPLSKSYNKMERPSSRRGLKTDITEYGLSRPPTTTKNISSRPPSASTLADNRIPTAAPRINIVNSAHLSRMNSGLPRNFTQGITLHRPVTQPRLASVHPTSSQDISKSHRQTQDKRHYKQLLHLKIRELNQELASLTRRSARQNEGTTTYYDKKTNDLAVKELQEQLNDYNTALDAILDTDREQFKQFAMKFKVLHDEKDTEIQYNRERRQSLENKMNELNKELENKEKLNVCADPESKLKFDLLNIEKNQVQKKFHALQNEYDLLISEKSKLDETISLSIKQEAYKLFLQIYQIEQKRDRLLEEELSSSVREDENVMENDVADIRRKIVDAEQELKRLEIEMNKDEAINRVQNNETNKENDVESDTLSLEQEQAEQLAKLNALEERIVENLERISISIHGNFDSSVLMPDEIEMLQVLMNQNFENHTEKTLDDINKEITRLEQILHRLEILETKIKGQVIGSKENFKSAGDLTALSNLRNSSTIKEMNTVEKDYSKLIEKIEQDEIHRLISIFDDKLSKTILDNEKLKHLHEEVEENYSLLLERLLHMISQYNSFLISDTKTTY